MEIIVKRNGKPTPRTIPAPAKAELHTVAPRVDVYETNEAYIVLADMPGVTAENVNVTLERNVLTLTGETGYPLEAENLAHVEFRPRQFRRVFSLTAPVAADEISATLKNGVLRLELPKAEPVKAQRISIKTGEN